MVRKLAASALWATLVLAVLGSPLRADETFGHSEWRAAREAIHELENRIARLEADPYVDDGYKAPIISGARAKIRRLHAELPTAYWRWADPCCYSRKPIRIR